MKKEQEQYLDLCKELWDRDRETSVGTNGVISDKASADIYEKLISSANLLISMIEAIKHLNVLDKHGHQINYTLVKSKYKTGDELSPTLCFNIHFEKNIRVGIQPSRTGEVEFIYDGYSYKNIDQDVLKLKNKILKHVATATVPDLLNPNFKELLLN